MVIAKYFDYVIYRLKKTKKIKKFIMQFLIDFYW
jgi:hypothetical protein